MSIDVQRLKTEGYHDNIDDAEVEIRDVLREHFARTVDFALSQAAQRVDEALKREGVSDHVRHVVSLELLHMRGLAS